MSEIRWETGWDQAMARAKREGKKVFLDFFKDS